MRLARRTRAKHRMLRPTPLLGRRADQEDALATLAPRLFGVRLAPFRKLLMRTSRRVAIDGLPADESCSDAHRSRSGRCVAVRDEPAAGDSALRTSLA